MTNTTSNRPARRRSRRGFGKLRKLPSGKWHASYIGPDQRRHNAPITYVLKGQGERWLEQERRLVENDEWTSPEWRAQARQSSATTLDEYAPDAIRRRRVRGRALKPRTVALYDSQYRRLIQPTFGSTPLRAITREAVASWYTALDEDKKTQRAHAYSLLRALLGQAVDEDIIATNPCHVRGAGKVAHAEHKVKIATEAQIDVICEHMPPNLALLPLLIVAGTLRIGEAMELRREDVDMEHLRIRIDRAVVRVGGEYVVGTPKSDAGRRVTALPPTKKVRTALQHHLDTYVGPEPDALLFARPGNRHVIHTEVTKAFRVACKAARRPDLHLHDLRHTSASWAAESGASLPELMARLGDSTPGAALRYLHAAEDRDAQIAAHMSAHFSG